MDDKGATVRSVDPFATVSFHGTVLLGLEVVGGGGGGGS